ncbi:putative ABC transport system ATP-binding protein [Stackebrandtia albiflava]|uniref:Putative ABC transport system ATP-binding protein n=1 Tax=Stackebrandtia albiflava TaxID=406432 RepID=A0A562UY26_9ACTN|nr:ABC transporter ATP-binding protein [Stackebrandtia albiflava]TWJ10506.1 putative ABC transport system ATP-binding protein [Stackebrandtia albiflava]
MLLVEDVAKRFKSGGGAVDAVDGVSFEIATGTFAAIVGRSGSGKSTLLGLLGALDSPSAGKITMDDVDVTALSPRGQVAYRRDRIGFVFQQYHLIPDLTAVQNVMLPMEFAGRRTAERRARAVELLDRVGLTGGKQTRLPGRLSGGEQQRVSVARALANRPSLILADEPTGNLDSRNGKRIITLLREFAGGGTTVVVVTHDRGLASRADLTLAMNDGRIVHRKSKT